MEPAEAAKGRRATARLHPEVSPSFFTSKWRGTPYAPEGKGEAYSEE